MSLTEQNILGLIYEGENNLASACDCFFIKAEIIKKDVDLWYQVYEMSCKLNLTKRQLYCLSRLIHLKPDEPSFYEKRYHLWKAENQPAKACNDLLALCKLTHDVVDYLPSLYELCCQLHREQEVMMFLDSEYNTMIARLSRSRFILSHKAILNDRLTGVATTESTEEMKKLETISVEAATEQLMRLLHSLYLLGDL